MIRHSDVTWDPLLFDELVKFGPGCKYHKCKSSKSFPQFMSSFYFFLSFFCFLIPMKLCIVSISAYDSNSEFSLFYKKTQHPHTFIHIQRFLSFFSFRQFTRDSAEYKSQHTGFLSLFGHSLFFPLLPLKKKKKANKGTSLVVQWLGSPLPMQGMRFQSLVR